MGIRYDPAEELNEAHFRGVRCLFMDLHLVDGQAGSDEQRHYGVIAAILEKNINPRGGPFILVVWTEHPHLSVELKNYLDVRLDVDKPHVRPLAVISLAKEKFINVDDGTVSDPPELQRAVQAAIASNPQLAALLGWETDVLEAAANTLASLLSLVPSTQRSSETFPAELDIVLSRLARATVGGNNVTGNPRAAITTALAPILIDRVLNQGVTEDVQEVWAKAVTRHAEPKLSPVTGLESGAINRMLHLAFQGVEALRPTDWGAVLEWPYPWTDEEMLRQTGLTKEAMVCEEFRFPQNAISNVKPILVRIGAACDYAQDNGGLIPLLFGFIIMESQKRDKGVKPSAAIWQSPEFLMPDAEAPSRLHIHFRFPQNHLAAKITSWTAIYRLREQLLMHLISSASTYASRPGIVELRAT